MWVHAKRICERVNNEISVNIRVGKCRWMGNLIPRLIDQNQRYCQLFLFLSQNYHLLSLSFYYYYYFVWMQYVHIIHFACGAIRVKTRMNELNSLIFHYSPKSYVYIATIYNCLKNGVCVLFLSGQENWNCV